MILTPLLTLQSYDDLKLKLAEDTGDERQARKFRSSTDGPKAAEYLEDLKRRVHKTKDNVSRSDRSCSVIVRVRVILKRTVVDDSD